MSSLLQQLVDELRADLKTKDEQYVLAERRFYALAKLVESISSPFFRNLSAIEQRALLSRFFLTAMKELDDDEAQASDEQRHSDRGPAL